MRISINWASGNCKSTRFASLACDEAQAGKPYSGNLSLRFEEGSGLNHPLLLYFSVHTDFKDKEECPRSTEKPGLRKLFPWTRTTLLPQPAPLDKDFRFVTCSCARPSF